MEAPSGGGRRLAAGGIEFGGRAKLDPNQPVLVPIHDQPVSRAAPIPRNASGNASSFERRRR